jgi:hypothetical protein
MRQAGDDRGASVPVSSVSPTAAATRTTPGRRDLVGGAAALVAAAVAATLPHTALAAGADPVLALWRQSLELDCQQDRALKPTCALRAALVARWGEPRYPVSAADLWGHDPEYHELSRLIDESDRISQLQTDIEDAIAATPATSLAGLKVKVRLAMSLWPTGKLLEETDHHEDFALEVLRDADRLLAKGL